MFMYDFKFDFLILEQSQIYRITFLFFSGMNLAIVSQEKPIMQKDNTPYVSKDPEDTTGHFQQSCARVFLFRSTKSRCVSGVLPSLLSYPIINDSTFCLLGLRPVKIQSHNHHGTLPVILTKCHIIFVYSLKS